jgi:hypothetical protein
VSCACDELGCPVSCPRDGLGSSGSPGELAANFRFFEGEEPMVADFWGVVMSGFWGVVVVDELLRLCCVPIEQNISR